MMLTPGPWRCADHDELEIWTYDGSAFIAAVASSRNAPAIAATPELLGLVLELAEVSCCCTGEDLCAPCRARHFVATFESSRENAVGP